MFNNFPFNCNGLTVYLGLGLGSVLGLILLETLSRYYSAHSITPC